MRSLVERALKVVTEATPAARRARAERVSSEQEAAERAKKEFAERLERGWVQLTPQTLDQLLHRQVYDPGRGYTWSFVSSRSRASGFGYTIRYAATIGSDGKTTLFVTEQEKSSTEDFAMDGALGLDYKTEHGVEPNSRTRYKRTSLSKVEAFPAWGNDTPEAKIAAKRKQAEAVLSAMKGLLDSTKDGQSFDVREGHAYGGGSTWLEMAAYYPLGTVRSK